MFRPVMFWNRARCVSTSIGASTSGFVVAAASPGASAIGPAEDDVPAIFSSAAVAEGARRLNDSRSRTQPNRNVFIRWGVIWPVNPAMTASRSVGALEVATGVAPRRLYWAPWPLDTTLD